MVGWTIVHIQIAPAESEVNPAGEIECEQAEQLVVEVGPTSAGITGHGNRRLLTEGQNKSRAADTVDPVRRLPKAGARGLECEVVAKVPVADSGQGVNLEVLAIVQPVADLRGKNRFCQMDIDRAVEWIGKGNPPIVTEFHPEIINRHYEVAFLDIHCDGDHSLEVVKEIAERGAETSVMAEHTNGSVDAGEPAVNCDFGAPAVVRRRGRRGRGRGRRRGCG